MILPGKISSLSFPIIILSIFILLSQSSFSQSPVKKQSQSKKEEWHLRKNENGIRIYSRRPAGSDVDEFRVISVMHASLSSIVALILDANHYPDWIYACVQSRVLQQVNATEQYQYQVIDVPTPFTDRDAVIHLTLWQDPKTKIVYTHSVAAPDFVPKKDGLVRLPVFDASYQLIPQANGDVKVVYSLRTDPGGYLPDWLVNWTIVTGPYQTTLKMREQMKKAEYYNAKLTFIMEP